MRQFWRMERHCEVLRPEQDIVWQDEPQRERQFDVSDICRLNAPESAPGVRDALGVVERRGAGCTRGAGTARGVRACTPREYGSAACAWGTA